MVGGATLTKQLGTSAWYAPGSSIAYVVDSVLNDHNRIIPCSVYLDGEYGFSDICIGVPCVIGKNGVEKIISLDLNEKEIQSLYDNSSSKDVIIFNVRSKSDSLRNDECKKNLFHIPPSYSMLSDALTQYLVKKKWNKWFLVTGPDSNDKEYADALKKSAKKFNIKIKKLVQFYAKVFHRVLSTVGQIKSSSQQKLNKLSTALIQESSASKMKPH